MEVIKNEYHYTVKLQKIKDSMKVMLAFILILSFTFCWFYTGQAIKSEEKAKMYEKLYIEALNNNINIILVEKYSNMCEFNIKLLHVLQKKNVTIIEQYHNYCKIIKDPMIDQLKKDGYY